jgi:hypothetical protein
MVLGVVRYHIFVVRCCSLLLELLADSTNGLGLGSEFNICVCLRLCQTDNNY